MDLFNRAYTLLEEGNKLYHANQFDEALRLYEASLGEAQMAVNDTGLQEGSNMVLCIIHNRKAAALHRLKRYKEVKAECEAMLKLGYLRRKAYIRLGGAASALEEYQLATRAYEHAMREGAQDDKDAALRAQLEQARQHAGADGEEDASQTGDFLKGSLADEREQIYQLEAHGTKAMMNEENYQSAEKVFSKAIEHAEKVLVTNPEDIANRATQQRLLGRRAHALRKMERFEEALRDAQRMIDIAPTSDRSYFRKAQVYLGMAQATLEDAVAKCPGSAEALRGSLNGIEVLMESLSHIHMMARQLQDIPVLQEARMRSEQQDANLMKISDAGKQT